MTISRQDVIQALNAADLAVNQWRADPQAHSIVFEQRNVRALEKAPDVRETWQTLFDLVQTTDVAPDARDLVLEIDAFEIAYKRFRADRISQPERTTPAGGDQLWTKWAAVLSLRKPRRRVFPEAISDLMRDPRNTLDSIARVYRWFDEHGRPDTLKVSEEVAKPGRHFNRDTWKSSADERYERDLAARWAQRTVDVKSVRDLPPPASIEELCNEPNITVAQIAKIHRITTEAVVSYMNANNLTLITTSGGRPDPKQMDEIQRRQKIADDAWLQTGYNGKPFDTHEHLGADHHARIKAMARDGILPGQIARALSLTIHGRAGVLTQQQVTLILRGKKDPKQKAETKPEPKADLAAV